jgi:hypothetical protein
MRLVILGRFILGAQTSVNRPLIADSDLRNLKPAITANSVTTIFLRSVLALSRTAVGSDQIFLCSFGCKSHRLGLGTGIDPQHFAHQSPYCRMGLDEYLS